MKNLKSSFLILALAGCTNKVIWQPTVDMKGVDPVAYHQDLRECQAYAEQIDTGRSALTGAIVGAAVGSAVGAGVGKAYGQTNYGLKYGAASGAAGGAASGTAKGIHGKMNVVRNCLSGRGYSVLN